jgi:hypothetical protein
VDRDQYREGVSRMWSAVRLLEPLPLLNLEIAARRRGTATELKAATLLRRAMDDMPKSPEQP